MLCNLKSANPFAYIKTHSSVSAAKKTKEDVQHTSVLFTGTVKLPNSAFCISETTMPISTKFTYSVPYIYTTLHIKIESNSFSSSWDIFSRKLLDFLHIFLLLHTKLQIYLSRIKTTFPYFDFFQIWNTYKAHFPKILTELCTIISQIFLQFVVTSTGCIINAMDLKILNQACAAKAARAWFLKIALVCASVCVCVSVCLPRGH